MLGCRDRGGRLTLVKVRRRRLALLLKLSLSVLLVRIVSLYVVPRIELERVVVLAQVTAPELEGIGSLLVVGGIVGPVRRDGLLLGFALVIEGQHRGLAHDIVRGGRLVRRERNLGYRHVAGAGSWIMCVLACRSKGFLLGRMEHYPVASAKLWERTGISQTGGGKRLWQKGRGRVFVSARENFSRFYGWVGRGCRAGPAAVARVNFGRSVQPPATWIRRSRAPHELFCRDPYIDG